MANRRALLGTLALLGCTGQITTPVAQPAPLGEVSFAAPCPISIPAIDGQRLTKLEYNNVVRDLFGLTDDFSSSFTDPASGSAGFTTESAAQNLSPDIVEAFYFAANAVADALFAKQPNPFLTCTSGDACATTLLTRLATRAFRRPPDADELSALIALYKSTPVFSDGMKLAVTGVLLAPQFIFRTHDLPEGAATEVAVNDLTAAPTTAVAFNDYELASRLSFFIWGSVPDDALLAAAADGTLRATLTAQTQRMLQDPKAAYLANTFSTQWLGLADLDGQERSAARYPLWSPATQASMRGETMAFMKNVILNDTSVMDVISAKYTFVDSNVASIYGIAGATGDFTRVDVDAHRIGVLTQPAILTLTSKGDATSPVRRGKWVLTELLCSAPPPPPPDVPPPPAGPSDGGVYGESQIQQRMAAHEMQGTTCYACHHAMDPIGMAFENFDAMGYYRTSYLDGVPVNASGKLPTGEQLDSVTDLANVLKNDKRFPSCFAAKLASFAQGKDMTTAADSCGIRHLAAAVGPDHTMSELVIAIVTSDTFLYRQVTP